MKNIHILPTDKPSRLRINSKGKLILSNINIGSKGETQNIYITSDEEIKEGDWHLKRTNNTVGNYILNSINPNKGRYNKIILTTDQDLIKDGVQPIDDEFLEWFVNNPSCEEVKIESWQTKGEWDLDYKIIIPKQEPKDVVLGYKTSIVHYLLKEESKTNLEKLPFPELVKEFVEYYENVPLTEEPKQETLEEAAKNFIENEMKFSFNSLDTKTQANRMLKCVDFGAKWQTERMYSEEEVKQIFNIGQMTKDYGDYKPYTFEQALEQFKKKYRN